MDIRTVADAVLGATLAIAMAAGLVFVAQTAAWRCCWRCRTLTRWTAVLAVVAWTATAIFHLLIVRGAFARGPALAAIALLAVVAWRVNARTGQPFGQPLAWARRDRVFVRRVARALARSPYRLVVAAFICGALPPVARALIVPPLGWDALTYHTVKAAMWVQHGTLAGMMIGFGPVLRRRRLAAVVLGAAGLCSVALYFSPSFAVVRYHWTENSSRFLLPAAAISAVLAVGWCRRRSLPARLFAIALVGCSLWNLFVDAVVGFSARSTQAAIVVCGALIVLGGSSALIARVRPKVLRTGLALALAIAAGASLQLFRDRLRSDLLQTDFTIHGFALWRSWSPAVALVDDPSVHYRIAVTSGPWQDIDNWFVYPFMGRRLQNEVIYVPVSGDGQLRHFGHAAQNEELSRSASLWTWQLRLQREHVTHVISFSPHSIELGWMEADGNAFERLAGAAGDWGLFRVR